MADKTLLSQMLEHLVNDEQAKAEELFHEYVVAQSREIYETLIESEMSDDDEEDEDEVEEGFEEFAAEADDEGEMGGDATDDLASELDDEMGDEEGSYEEEEAAEDEIFQDLESIIDELQAKFDELKGIEDHGDEGEFGDEDEMGSDEEGEMDFGAEPEDEMKDSFDLETVREYVEKVPAAKMGDNGANTKSTVAGKNDMGGTTANIAKGGVAKGEGTKGGLLNPSAKEDNAGNINVPGGKAGNAFSKKEPGHGAEKKGAAEQAQNKQSLFRGRR